MLRAIMNSLEKKPLTHALHQFTGLQRFLPSEWLIDIQYELKLPVSDDLSQTTKINSTVQS